MIKKYSIFEAYEALIKCIPKKPSMDDAVPDLLFCPNCGVELVASEKADCCYNCGQAIDWSK